MGQLLSTTPSVFSAMDNVGLFTEHWKIMLISGMGFFIDSYDLFVVGVVMSLLKPLWHVSKVEQGLVTSTALLAAAMGKIGGFFGLIATVFLPPKIKGKCLEELSEEPMTPVEKAAA
jgi:PHS family inorganic phosphate transporter-like MFS transporter